MLKVGLTGNIAAGKSSVVRVWRSMGAAVVDADELARRAVEPGTPALRRIVEAWGSGVLDPSGALDRAALRRIVFADPEARARLEAIVHPAVHALREEEYRRAAEGGAPLVVADVPLLFEVGMADEFDVLVLVDAPEEERMRRLVEDRGLDPEEAGRMIDAQMPAELKRARADLVVSNAGTREELEAAARDAWSELARRAEAARG
ncbi:MAG TPA: dephospho-CoA kinase [Longimicrobiaceae bacterium]|nr:dephospho-CoA kinase [Longimicrobiaceae bacterium]